VTGVLLCPACFQDTQDANIQKGDLTELDQKMLALGGEFMRVVMMANQVGAEATSALAEDLEGAVTAQEEVTKLKAFVDHLADEVADHHEKLKGTDHDEDENSDRP